MIELNRLCRKGVSSLRQKDVANDGPYPVYGASGIVGFTADYQNEERYVAVIKDGAGVGRVCACEPKSSVLGTMQALLPAESVDCDYLLYLVRSMKLGDGFTGSTIPHIYFKDYGKRLLVEHNRSEQRQIAESLNAVESQTVALKMQQEGLDELVKARFVEMFGSGEWPIIKSGEFFYGIRNGVSPSRNGNHHETVLTLSAITQGSFDTSACKEDSFKAKPPEDKRVMAYDFYMCRGNGNKALVGAGEFATKDRRDLVFPDTVIAAHVDRSRVDLAYLRETWRQPYAREQIESMAKTTNGTYKVNQTMVKSIQLKIPPLALQQEFAAFVARVDQLKADTQLAIDKLQMLYDSLAQEYFSE